MTSVHECVLCHWVSFRRLLSLPLGLGFQCHGGAGGPDLPVVIFIIGVELLTTKDVTKDLMSQVEWALSDKENTFTALNRTEGGLLYSKNGNEHLKQDYYQKIESTLAVCLSDPRTGRERNGLDGKDSSLHLL